MRMDRLESMIDDHRKELASLKNRMVEIKKAGGGSADTSAMKNDHDVLKKEVIGLWSSNLSTFFDRLEDP